MAKMEATNMEQLVKDAVELLSKNLGQIIKEAVEKQTENMEHVIKTVVDQQTKDIQEAIDNQTKNIQRFTTKTIQKLSPKQESKTKTKVPRNTTKAINPVNITKNHVPSRLTCIHKNCPLKNFENEWKYNKHLTYFCQWRFSCPICNEVLQDLLSVHYGLAHQNITDKFGSTWRATRTNAKGVTSNHADILRLGSSDAGIMICWYVLKKRKFELLICIPPVLISELYKFRCSVRLSNPVTGQWRMYTPKFVYNAIYDWRILVKKDEFLNWSGMFDVIIEINKIY